MGIFPGNPGALRRAKRLWKRRAESALGNQKPISTFPQPQQQQAVSGYKSNGATWEATVTFSNGLTRSSAGHPGTNQARLRSGNFHHQIEFPAADLIVGP
jgi:hypothetical protein